MWSTTRRRAGFADGSRQFSIGRQLAFFWCRINAAWQGLGAGTKRHHLTLLAPTRFTAGREDAMDTPREAVLLRIFAAETDRVAGRGLYRAVVDEARKTGLAGATVFQGPLSYGQTSLVNSKLNVDAPQNLPVVIEIIDDEDRIQAFLPKLDGLIGSGLVTLETVRVTRAGRRAEPGPVGPGGASRSGSPGGGTSETGGVEMELPHDAVLLRIFTSVDDRCGVEEPLYHAIVMKAREMNLGGATVLKGILGYGQSNRLHQPHLLTADDRPVR